MKRVFMSSLRAGDRFTPAYGGHWTYERPHASEGAFCCVREDGHRDLFAGCAEVTPGWHEKGWLEDGDVDQRRVA